MKITKEMLTPEYGFEKGVVVSISLQDIGGIVARFATVGASTLHLEWIFHA